MKRHVPKFLAACALTLNPSAVVVFVHWLTALEIRSGSEYSFSIAHRGPPELLTAALMFSILGVVSTIAYLVLSGRARNPSRSTVLRALTVVVVLATTVPAVIIVPASLWQLPAAEEQARREPVIPKKPGINALLRDLSDEDYMVRHGAAKGLASEASLPEKAIPKLLKAAERDEGETSIYAVNALSHFPDNTSEVIPGLVALLGKRQIGSWAAEALGVYWKPGVDALLDAAKSEKWRVRESAAHGLSKANYFDDEVIVRLTELLHDEDASVRTVAASSLGLLGVKSESALPELASMANDPDPKVRGEAERAVEGINWALGSRK